MIHRDVMRHVVDWMALLCWWQDTSAGVVRWCYQDCAVPS